MHDLKRGPVAPFFRRLDLGEAGAAALAFGDELRGRRVIRGNRLGERVRCGERDEARAEDRVGARGENLDLVNVPLALV